jgi:serine kinase of HPr protein (carbohydrate metabolism regulator)
LRLLDRGFTLVSDDQTVVKKDGERLVASAPPNIAGKLEMRGIGIVDMETVTNIPVALLVELTSEIQRLPDESRERPLLGVKLPLISIDAMTASAPSKVALALDRMGLKF